MNTNITNVVEQINKEGKMTQERVNEIINAMFAVEDYECIYKKKDSESDREYEVFKSETDAYGFEITFHIWFDEEEESEMRTVHVSQIVDLYAVISMMVAFDKNPYAVIVAIDEMEETTKLNATVVMDYIYSQNSDCDDEN